MWIEFWGLGRDPFADGDGPYVATPGHDEAAARLAHAVESGQRSIGLACPAGLGKSVVLRRALEGVRSPSRKLAVVRAPLDGTELFSRLAEGLAPGRPAPIDRRRAWRALADAARLCRWQGQSVVLAVDDAQTLGEAGDRADLERLEGLLPPGKAGLTVIRVGRDDPRSADPEGWELRVRLGPLTLSESARYVTERIAAAGRGEPAFTPKGLEELHRLAGGVPRGLNRLATLALIAGAVRGLELVSAPCVADSSLECVGPATP